jgi:DNA polymerase III sliding clamp (beta) subunit (PCNA family)
VSEVKGGAGYEPLEFTASRFQLVQLARWAGTAVPSSVTLGVNACFQVTVSPDMLRMAAVDQAKCVIAETPAVRSASSGTVYIPAKKLEAILSAAPEGDVTVSVKGSSAAVTAGSASWDLRLPGPDGYTGLPDLAGAACTAVSRQDLLTALATVRHAVGKDDGRPAYRQVRIAESGGVTYACATDSSQFSRALAPWLPAPLCVPGAALDDLVKLLSKSAGDDVEVAETGSHAVFRAGPVTLAALRLSAEFPDTDSLFLRQAAGNDMTLTVDKAALSAALSRVRVNCDAKTSAVALIADSAPRPALTVEARDAAGNSAAEPVAATWDGGYQMLVVSAGHLEALLAAHPAPECEFRIGRDRGHTRPPLLLEAREAEAASAKVTGTIPQMVPHAMGYGKRA